MKSRAFHLCSFSLTIRTRRYAHTRVRNHASRTVFEWRCFEPELHVLGHLLEEADSDAFDLDWYSLDRKNLNGAGIRKRSDRCTASSDGSTLEISTLGGSGRFIQRFDGTGRRLIRRSPLQGGGELILESIDPRDLIDLYTRKDLPVR